MSKELNDLVRKTETAISRDSKRAAAKPKPVRGKLQSLSVAISIWLIAILFTATQFDTLVLMISGPAESRIEQDLSTVLESSASSLRNYELRNGVLPPLLPNPSIRGLVQYERKSDYTYLLRASIGEVTMELDSNAYHPVRVKAKP